MNAFRKMTLVAVIASLALTTGCISRYKITFTDQHITTSRGKPRLDKAEGVYRFKDTGGRKCAVPAFKIQSIEPL